MPLPNQIPLDARSLRRKLVRAMGYFTLAMLALGLVFLLLWLWGSPADPQSATPVQTKPAKAGPTAIKSAAPETAPVTPVVAPSTSQDETAAKAPTKRVTIQGPQAGEVVAPPTRDVTPNYQFSPLHQTKPLTREKGLPLPPKPKREPLPKVFRHVLVKSPTELILQVSKGRKARVNLAHVDAPQADRDCWLDGRKAPCLALGKTSLRRYLRQRAVACHWLDVTKETSDEEDAKSRDALCYLGTGLAKRQKSLEDVQTSANVSDIARWLVRYGWVIPEAGFYEEEHRSAQANALGVYATEGSANTDSVKRREKEWQELSTLLEDATSEVNTQNVESDLYSDDESVGELTLIAPREELDEPSAEPLPAPPGVLIPPTQ